MSGPLHTPKIVAKPWGREIWFADQPAYAGKVLEVKAGRRLSLQYHVQKDETSYLLRGRMLLTKGADPDHLSVVEIGPGHQWRNRPGEIHTIEAIEDADVLEVSTPHLDDVVRLQDSYGREGTNAP